MRSPFLTVFAAAVLALTASCSEEKPAEEQPSAAPTGVETPIGAAGDSEVLPTSIPVDEEPGEQMTIEQRRAEALAKIDVAACEQAGGKVQQEGMLGMPRCVTPYKDAGKSCRDGDDCEGKCLGDDAVTEYNAEPGKLVGVCQANDSPFGCYAEIEDGSTQGMICVD